MKFEQCEVRLNQTSENLVSSEKLKKTQETQKSGILKFFEFFLVLGFIPCLTQSHFTCF